MTVFSWSVLDALRAMTTAWIVSASFFSFSKIGLSFLYSSLILSITSLMVSMILAILSAASTAFPAAAGIIGAARPPDATVAVIAPIVLMQAENTALAASTFCFVHQSSRPLLNS